MSYVIIKNDRYTVDPVYQWDVNQVLQIHGLSLSRVPEVHFSSVALESALVRQCTMDGTGVITVDIPNSLLQRPYPIKAHICLYEGKTFKSLYTIDIPIKPRKMPTDYTLETGEEYYSFNEINNRLNQVETELGLDKAESFYKYEYKGDNLTESKVTTTRRLYIPIISTSLKAIKSFFDKIATTLKTVETTANNALSLAKERNQARVFDTTEDMKEWLSDEKNANKCNVGDCIYIEDRLSPDWRICEVLDTVDLETGYYYKIVKLEKSTNRVTLWTNQNVKPSETVDGEYEFSDFNIAMDLSEYNRFTILFVDCSILNNKSTFTGIVCEYAVSVKNVAYNVADIVDYNVNNIRGFTITDNGITFGGNMYGNNYMIPYQIIGYKA